MKRLIKLTLASLCALALTVGVVTAAPGTGASSFGITNALLSSPTIYTNTLYANYYGSSLSNLTCGAADVRYNRTGTLWLSGQVVCSNQVTVTIVLLPGNSVGGLSGAADPASTPALLTWTFLPPIGAGTPGTLVTNSFLAITNMPDLGALTTVNLLSIKAVAATGTGGILNPSLNIDTKNAQFPQ